jgi:hypothetical protein
MKFQLKDFFTEVLLKEEGELNYNADFGGEKFKVIVDVNKNPSKKGIKLKFYPINEQGQIISNLTDEELKSLQNSLATDISPLFSKYGLEIDRDTDAPQKDAINFQIPLDSVFSFIKNVVLGEGEESVDNEELPDEEIVIDDEKEEIT